MNATALQMLLVLVAAHILGDFLLQPRRLAENKRHPGTLVVHVAIVTAVTYVLYGAWSEWRLPLAVFLLHITVDAIKAWTLPRNLGAFLADQALHLSGLTGIAIWLESSVGEPFWGARIGETYYDAAVLLAGFVVVTRGAGFAVGLGVRSFQVELTEAGRGETNGVSPQRRGFERGGRTIGYLERTLIYLMVLAGHPGGVGFLLAAKSILRFGELKEPRRRMEAEYIIIGTLASFAAGLAISFVTAALLRIRFHVP